MDIKTPISDKPSVVGTLGGRKRIRPEEATVEAGTKIGFLYRDKFMTAEVTAVEEPGARFIARVEGFDSSGLEYEDLRHGDLFRFNRRDLRSIG